MDFLSSLFKIDLPSLVSDKTFFFRLAAGVVIFLLCLIYRNRLSRFFVKLCTKPIARKNETAQKAIIDSLTKPIAVFIAALGFYAGADFIAPTAAVRPFLVTLLKLCAIVVVAWAAIGFINSDFSIFLNGDDSKTKKTALAFIGNLTKVVIILIAALLALEQFGIKATKIFATLGIGGVAIAFACKDAVENMISGFIIIFGKPFEVEDCIKLDGEIGIVEDIKIRTTRLKMIDGSEKVYPNTIMVNSPVINLSRMDKRAVEETLWFDYSYSGEEIKAICQQIKEIILGYDIVIKDDVRVNFLSFGEHALEVTIFFYTTETATPRYQEFINTLNSDIKDYVNKNSVKLSFDCQTVYFGNELSLKK